MKFFKGLIWGTLLSVVALAIGFFAFLGIKTICQFIGGVL